jgi:polysaccharide pyruvyl transferase WcaK-like protein
MHSAQIKSEKSKFLRYLKTYLPFWQRKKIGFYGYFGHGDIGDDTVFIVTQDLLGQDLMPLSKRCYAFNPARLKGFLIGGGAVLKRDCPYIPRRILQKDKWNFPIILFSAGVGCDYQQEFTSEARDKIQTLCSLCGYLTVRDKISQRFINSLGFQDVEILPHLELMLTDKCAPVDWHKEGRCVGVVLTSHPEFSTQTFQKIIEVFSQLNNYLTDKGYTIIYMPFENNFTENATEQTIIKEIIRRSQRPEKVRILANNLQPSEILFIMRNYIDIMVCMRLHSAVLSVNAGIPFVCLSYNLMHKGFLEMLDSPELEVSIFDDFSSSTLLNSFEYVFSNQTIIREKLIQKRELLKNMIIQQVSHIKSIL